MEDEKIMEMLDSYKKFLIDLNEVSDDVFNDYFFRMFHYLIGCATSALDQYTSENIYFSDVQEHPVSALDRLKIDVQTGIKMIDIIKSSILLEQKELEEMENNQEKQ